MAGCRRRRTPPPHRDVRNRRTTWSAGAPPSRLLEQAGEAAVLEDATLRLALRAVAHHVVLVEDRLERGRAARAGRALVGVDARRLGELLRQRQLDGLLVVLDHSAELGDHRHAQPAGLLLGEVVAALER